MPEITGASARAILDHLYDAVFAVAPDLTIDYWNAGAEALTGYAADAVVGRPYANSFLVHVDDDGYPLAADADPLPLTLRDGVTRETHAYLHHQQGHRLPVHARVTPIRDAAGAVAGAVEILSDDTEWRTSQLTIQRLASQALLDELTEVGNRRDARRQLVSRLNEWRRYGVLFGILTLDLNDFSALNATYGRLTGDRVLKMVAQTLQHAVRQSDAVCRWGGDEFVIVLVNQTPAGLRSVAEKLQLLVESTFLNVEDGILSPSITIGSTLPSPADTVDTLLERIDGIMQRRAEA
jgi:diguanylate cyclase (GGDEF)-like protein/PAS domain S-box-containing protein